MRRCALTFDAVVDIEATDRPDEHSRTAHKPAQRRRQARAEQEEHTADDEESVAGDTDADGGPLVVPVEGLEYFDWSQLGILAWSLERRHGTTHAQAILTACLTV